MPEVQNVHKPQVLVPYLAPDPREDMLDVFLYLRPETNGVAVESTILQVVQRCTEYRAGLSLVYLANVPGDFIVANHIVERHYELRLHFAVHGAAAFTADMRTQFESFFKVPFNDMHVIGAFEALRELDLSVEDLFDLWVAEDQVVRIAGQVVKHFAGRFIVNYDIPALLHKNNAATDIAVMLFRTAHGYPHFFALAQQMRQGLVAKGLLSEESPIARAVHISRSPFEQLLDARDYLLTPDSQPVDVLQSSFGAYLFAQGFTRAQIEGLSAHPVCSFDFGVEAPSDQNLYDLCEGFSYGDARAVLSHIRSQYWFPTV